MTATGPVGSGAGGSYTVADTQPGGVLDTRYRAGGAVRRYAEGGPVQSQDLTQGYDYKAAEKERETQTQQAQTDQAVQATQQAEEERSTRSRSQGGAGSSFESAFAAAAAVPMAQRVRAAMRPAVCRAQAASVGRRRAALVDRRQRGPAAMPDRMAAGPTGAAAGCAGSSRAAG